MEVEHANLPLEGDGGVQRVVGFSREESHYSVADILVDEAVVFANDWADTVQIVVRHADRRVRRPHEQARRASA